MVLSDMGEDDSLGGVRDVLRLVDGDQIEEAGMTLEYDPDGEGYWWFVCETRHGCRTSTRFTDVDLGGGGVFFLVRDGANCAVVSKLDEAPRIKQVLLGLGSL